MICIDLIFNTQEDSKGSLCYMSAQHFGIDSL